MLTLTTCSDMLKIIEEAHPFWDPTAKEEQAKHALAQMDARLDPIIHEYAQTGKVPYFKEKCYSISDIIAMRRGCSFYEAIRIMNVYLNDEREGRILLQRR